MKTYGVKIESSLVKFSQKLFFKKVSSSATASNVLTLNSNDELIRVASSNLSFDGLVNTNVDTNKFVVLGSDGYLAYRTGTEIQDDLDVTPGTDVVNLVTMTSDSGHGARSAQTGQPAFTFLGGTDIGVTNSGGTFTVAFTNDTGYTTNTGDITQIRIDADDSNVASATSGSADFTIAGGEGIDTSVSGTTITVAGEDASASNKGVVELATTAETTTGTDATRAVTPDGLKDGYQGSTNVTTLGSITTGVWRGDVIDQAYLAGQSGTNTGDEPDASESVKGIVELATTAEADTGTDTARAVTPAGLKSHVDARVIPWVVITGQFNPGSGTAYYAPNNQGILNGSWTNTDANFDDGTETIPFWKQNGFIVPSDCTLVNIRGYIRYGVSKSYKFKILKIAAGDILYESNGNASTTRIFESSTIAFSDSNSSRYIAVDISSTASLAEGDMLIPMIKNTDGDYSANTHFQFSFSIKV